MVKIIKLENSDKYPDRKIIKINDTNNRFEEAWFDDISKKDAASIIAKLATGRNNG